MSKEEHNAGDVEIVSCKVIGNKIFTAMRAKKLTQEGTVRRARIMTLRQLGRIMKGENCPSLERAVALTKVLDLPVEELFTVKLETRNIVPDCPIFLWIQNDED